MIFAAFKSSLAKVFPSESPERLGTEARARIVAYRRICTLAISILTLSVLFILCLERFQRGDNPISIISGVASLVLMIALAFSIRAKAPDLKHPRMVMNLVMVAQFLFAVHANGELPLHMGALLPVAFYMLNRIILACSLSAIIFVGIWLIMAQRNFVLNEPELLRLGMTYIFTWIISHTGHVFFVNFIHHLNEQLQLHKNFSSVLAHEVRTPLATMVGSVDVAKLNGAFDRHPSYYENIKRSGASLLELVNSTLDYRKIQAGEFQINPTKFHPKMLLNELVSEVNQRLGNKAIRFNIVDNLPEGLLLVSDRTKTKQILGNLLANSVKFTTSGGIITLTSNLSKGKKQETWCVQITDTGIGMSQEQLEKIFQPFVQASSGVSRKYGGTGLGLALSQAIAEAMGGKIFASSPGLAKGASFTVELPVTTLKAIQDESELEIEATYYQSLEELKVLLVEDVELNAEIAAQLIEHVAGRKPTVAHTGEEALGLLHEGAKFDVILMDINLGDGINGLEATRRILSTYEDRSPKIYALTAGLLDEDKEAINDVGMDGILGKPIDMFEIRRALSEVAENKASKLDDPTRPGR